MLYEDSLSKYMVLHFIFNAYTSKLSPDSGSGRS